MLKRHEHFVDAAPQTAVECWGLSVVEGTSGMEVLDAVARRERDHLGEAGVLVDIAGPATI